MTMATPSTAPFPAPSTAPFSIRPEVLLVGASIIFGVAACLGEPKEEI
jgi:hypothetical protein